MAETLLCCKAESAGGKVEKINPCMAKLLQRCLCGEISKKPLSLCVHDCKCGRYALGIVKRLPKNICVVKIIRLSTVLVCLELPPIVYKFGCTAILV